jgi:hypothetical protein
MEYAASSLLPDTHCSCNLSQRSSNSLFAVIELVTLNSIADRGERLQCLDRESSFSIFPELSAARSSSSNSGSLNSSAT